MITEAMVTKDETSHLRCYNIIDPARTAPSVWKKADSLGVGVVRNFEISW
jgi:hypothetical protein